MRIQSLLYWTVFIMMGHHSSYVRTATSPPSSVIECSSQTVYTQLIQDTSKSCCLGLDVDTSTCIASTFKIPPNQQRISLVWNATMRVPLTRGFRGIRLDVWTDEMVSCPDTCFTITHTQDEANSNWDGAVSFFLNCYISQTGMGFGVDVLPVFKYSDLVEELHCHELFKFPVPRDITVTPSPPTTIIQRVHNTTPLKPERAVNGISTTKSMEKWPTPSVGVALLILAVLGSVSCFTVLVWCIVQLYKGGGLCSPQQTFNNKTRKEVREKDIQLTQCLEPPKEVSKGGSAGGEIPHLLKDSLCLDSASVTSLPESFRLFIKNVNTDT